MVDDPMEYLGTLGLLIVGGNDTTRNSITGGVLALADPKEYEKLRADHGLVTTMVPEIIRWQTPLMHMRRTALEDVELGGKTIRKGDKIVMWYLSGNRDETVIDRADDFIIDGQILAITYPLVWYSPLHGQPFGGNAATRSLENFETFRDRGGGRARATSPSNFVRGYTELPVVVHPY